MRTPDPKRIQEAAKLLARGEIVAFPTETVYGLGADALSDTAVESVFKVKGRPPTNPLIVHVASVQMAKSVTRHWPPAAQLLADVFWPGPLSIILPKADAVPPIVTAGGDTVAVRCPDHPLALELIRSFGRPIVAPSANKSGTVSPTTAKHVEESFPELDLSILDGGPCQTGIESTVLSLVHEEPTILRLGSISPQQISSILDCNVHVESSLQRAHAEDQSKQHTLSPGTSHSHYAPQAPVVLFKKGEFDSIRNSCQGLIVALVMNKDAAIHPPSRVHLMPESSSDYARALYAALREADSQNPALIAVELPPCVDGENWQAVLDRLHRAAAPR